MEVEMAVERVNAWMRSARAVLVALAVACGGGGEKEADTAAPIDPADMARCEEYVAASVSCVESAYADAQEAASLVAGIEATCDLLAESGGAFAMSIYSEDYVTCVVETYEAADCATPEDFLAATESLEDCIGIE